MNAERLLKLLGVRKNNKLQLQEQEELVLDQDRIVIFGNNFEDGVPVLGLAIKEYFREQGITRCIVENCKNTIHYKQAIIGEDGERPAVAVLLGNHGRQYVNDGMGMTYEIPADIRRDIKELCSQIGISVYSFITTKTEKGYEFRWENEEPEFLHRLPPGR